jgi:hypothetical protein
MGLLVYPVTLTAGTNENVNDLNSNLTQIATVLNGGIDAANITNNVITADKLTTTVAQQLGLNNAANIGRGVSVIATNESRSNVAYGTLTTPDQVANVVLPTNGLIKIRFQATWLESVALAARAAIFIGPTQLKRVAAVGAAPAVQEVNTQSAGTVGTGMAIGSGSGGLYSMAVNVAYPGDVTTGQVVGVPGGNDSLGIPVGWGPCEAWAAAGTYTISIQWKASSGSVSALNRKLWVTTEGF